MATRILAFAGSLRQGSLNKKLVRVAARGAEEAGAQVTHLDLADHPLPIFDQDLEQAEGLPDAALMIKDLMKTHQGFLIACPEYNSSITAALKNTIDWASRPAEGETPLECYAGKVAGLMAASPGALGGLRGLNHVRSILMNIRVLVIPEQRAISAAHEAFDGDGKLKDDGHRKAIEAIGARVAVVTRQLASG